MVNIETIKKLHQKYRTTINVFGALYITSLIVQIVTCPIILGNQEMIKYDLRKKIYEQERTIESLTAGIEPRKYAPVINPLEHELAQCLAEKESTLYLLHNSINLTQTCLDNTQPRIVYIEETDLYTEKEETTPEKGLL